MTDLRTLALAATPGPWRHGPLWWEVWQHNADGEMTVRVASVGPAALVDDGAERRAYEPTAAYIATASPPVVLALLDLVPLATLGAGLQHLGNLGVLQNHEGTFDTCPASRCVDARAALARVEEVTK